MFIEVISIDIYYVRNELREVSMFSNSLSNKPITCLHEQHISLKNKMFETKTISEKSGFANLPLPGHGRLLGSPFCFCTCGPWTHQAPSETRWEQMLCPFDQ